ncbi:predicted protein [Sclerotinia sclerotiorum 1980 UF-70]|uniref:Uncharacterized protein n=2 Tax=Sclerotinia sclerotiorum (strain ATCC 18683 / 1980 / Ss-1) TaxID=665079 RepID=A7EGB7_SCLS1|nr:predicted protein [Sclerotinia sclerotiorum 1980 UF-70]APA06966.1 hypothetical protein sscle_02g017360 [Sclerotinia sclerotiorum 1980 UF-70]EDO01883.1 predicted protein [Sclerotinia sclerotiorum 1980 UF-70]
MNTRKRMPHTGRSLEDIPEESDLSDCDAAKDRPQIIKPDSEDTPRSQTQQPNFPGFSFQQAGSIQSSRIQTYRPVASSSSSTIQTYRPVASDSSSTIPSSTFRESSTTGSSQDPSEIPFKWNNPHPFYVQDEKHSVHEIPDSPQRSKESNRQRICAAFRDIWIEIKSRIKCESKIERDARKVREVRRRDSIADTAATLAGIETQLKKHKEKEEKRNSDALARAKENEIEVKAKEERRKAAVKRSKEKEERECKKEKKREKEKR